MGISLTYCEKFGFDANRIAEHLQWLEFSAADHATVQQLQQDIIQPHAETIVATVDDGDQTTARRGNQKVNA